MDDREEWTQENMEGTVTFAWRHEGKPRKFLPRIIGVSAEIQTAHLPNTSQMHCRLSQLSGCQCEWMLMMNSKAHDRSGRSLFKAHAFVWNDRGSRWRGSHQEPDMEVGSRMLTTHNILCLIFSLTHFCQVRFIGNDKRMRVYSMTCLLPVNCSAFWTVRKAYS
jgi:hypothetical protein